jgi:ketosteroid isomerase-like protein
MVFERMVLVGWVVTLTASCVVVSSDSEALLREYLAASNAHDLATLRSLTHSDIIWRLGPFVFEGKEEALRPHGTDLGLSGSFESSDVVVRGDTVEVVLIERNDATRAYGPDSLVHYARYVFRDGLMWRKEAYRLSESIPDFRRRGEPFRAWVSGVYPDRARRLFDDEGADLFGVERSRLLSQLLTEWVDAGRPGA